jgi:hypothetical protein
MPVTDPKSIYASYDGFLKNAIERHWSERRNRIHFVSLLLASREAWEVAWGGITSPDTPKAVLTGAGGAAAVYVLLRIFVGGPIGVVLTGISVASLVAIYAQNHRRIWSQQERYRKLLGDYRVKYDGIRASYIEGTIPESQRDLMIDGLLVRFLDEIDDEPDAPVGAGGVKPKDPPR